MVNDFDITKTPQYSQFIHISRYSRWLEEEKRRETWDETVQRYIDFWISRFPEYEKNLKKYKKYIKQFKVMPSMRALTSAGPALDKHEVAGYNCAFTAVDNQKVFDEILYILMCGTGVGFSVERQYINKLPEVAEEFYDSDTTIIVPDSKKGWASSLRELISLLYSGKVPKWDLSRLRPAGARLKTFGGRSSGPEPLNELFEFTVNLFKKAAGRKLSSIECHDLVCKIADIVVVGGVRRSALLSLSNLSDDRMRLAKSGQWWIENQQRQLSNNSACYSEKPEFEIFLKEWLSLYHSKSGERGIFSLVAAQKKANENGRRDGSLIAGTNPCSEIILRIAQFCNLTEIVIRSEDTLEDLIEKAKVATIFGTFQATLTNFKYLRKVWKRNTEEERLLGVSMTGIMDHPILGTECDEAKEWLTKIKEICIDTNKRWAKKLDIAQSAAVTCVKPSGCRPKDSLTCTDQGILTLEELLENHGNNEKWGDIEGVGVYQENASVNKISKTYVNGISDIIKIRLSYNLELESTPNHKWFVKQRYMRNKLNKYIDVNKWVRADEIKENDILDISMEAYRKESESVLNTIEKIDFVKHSSNKFEFKQPKHMNPDLAWLIGYFYGDGCLSENKFRIRFMDNNISNLEKVVKILKENFGILTNINKASQERNAWILEKGSVELYSWMMKNEFNKEKMLIPRKIRESSKESIIAFYAGLLDSDGCISYQNEKAKFIFTTAYDDFAKQLQNVAWAVGLGVGRSLNKEGENFQNNKNIWMLTSCSYQDKKSIQTLKKHSQKASKVRNWVFEDSQHSLILGKVISTKISENPIETFDIEVENKHWYYAGCVKSHNTVSQLVNSSSGIHARFSDHYIRRVRIDKKDPLCEFMIAKGFPGEQDVMNSQAWVFEFPIKSPQNSTKVNEETALEQLKIWKQYQDYWCEHKPSCTVYYTDNDFMDVGSWVWKNFDEISGISFLPYSDHVYRQAPYEAISAEKYAELSKKMPEEVDWTSLSDYEKEDSTKASKELACSAGVCEVVDLL